MGAPLLIARLLLAAVFAVAGVAKLLDLPGSRRAVGEFGVPARAAAVLGTLLPLAELAIAGALLAGPTAATGAVAAVALLTGFCVALAWNLARGRAPDCHCFGRLHSSPAGPLTLARNGGLLAVAAFTATGADPVAAAAVAIAALATLAAVALISRGQPANPTDQSPAEGLSPGTPAPRFRLPELTGGTRTLDSLRAGGLPVLLLFTDPGCGPCIELAPEVARWQREHTDELVIAVIEREGDGRAGHDPHGRANVLLQRDSEIADLYGAPGTPSGVLIGSDGAVAGPVVAGATQIEALVARTVDGFESRQSRETARRPVLALRLRRRELVARGAGAWAAMGVVAARPLRAVAGVSRGGSRAAEPCERDFECATSTNNREECRGGFCRCREGLNRVNGRCRCDRGTFCSTFGFAGCVNLQDDPGHCGECNRDCHRQGYEFPVCCDGQCNEVGESPCACGDSNAVCDSESICVVDTQGNLFCQNCSAFGSGFRPCGNQCGDPDTDVCCDGVLHRGADLGPGDWKCCGPRGGARVVNLDADSKNCGGCDRRCPADKPLCYKGKCIDKCPRRRRRCGDTCGHPKKEVCCQGRVYPKSSGIRNCRGRCKDTKSDRSNCGECGRRCNGPFDTGECCQGNCCDINGSTCCPDGCTNTQLDDDNCGGCGNKCGIFEFCRFGVCTSG